MKHYISLEGLHLLSETPENIGYTKSDFESGKLLEIGESLVELAEQHQDNPNRLYKVCFPAKYYYIKSGKVLAFTKPLGPGYELGKTFNDYLAGKYVELLNEQVDYYLAHKNDSIASVWVLGVKAEEVVDIKSVRSQKLSALTAYDNSDKVNEFLVNGMGAWFTPTERTNYSSSISAAKTLGVDTLSFYIGSLAMTVPTIGAEQMLAAIQLYADSCFIVTKTHESAINKLETIEEIEAYDFTTGYPEKLNFTI